MTAQIQEAILNLRRSATRLRSLKKEMESTRERLAGLETDYRSSLKDLHAARAALLTAAGDDLPDMIGDG